MIPQVELYYQQTDGDKMRYYTLSLEGVGNKLVGKQNIYKEVAWFNQGDNFIVSGDQSSGFIYNYNLDSQQYNLSISEEATSGLL
ncbi:MAG: hypothetical protein J6S85_26125 [Methanobrevibacter sp.]|nr:hypothetical protein [Methanobrevibacter sp.]MBO7717070.1 hypothetical protein [Methanobrevibacter sp.]